MRIIRLRVLAMCVGMLFSGASGGLHAQDKPAGAETAKKKRAKPAKTRARDKAVKAETQAPPTAAPTAPAAAPKDDAPVSTAAEGDVRKEGGSEVKVLEFSGLDIEGQLKTPQMLYFLRRLRAEFGRPTLPHRSFLPELEQTTKDEEF